MNRLLSVLILTVVVFAKVAAAGVELRESTINCESENVPAGTTVTVNVVIKTQVTSQRTGPTCGSGYR